MVAWSLAKEQQTATEADELLCGMVTERSKMSPLKFLLCTDACMALLNHNYIIILFLLCWPSHVRSGIIGSAMSESLPQLECASVSHHQ